MSRRSKSELFVHLVWGTLRRRAQLDAAVEAIVVRAVADRCVQLRCPAVAIGGTSDQVHALVRLHPGIAVARLVSEVKGFSSHFVTKVHGAPLQWQHGYGAFTIAAEDVPAVSRYVIDQKRHHAANALNLSFEPTYE